jgi:hypothetical protein
MYYCEDIWTDNREVQVTAQDRNHCSQILLQSSPLLIRFLQSVEFLQWGWCLPLFKIHFLLNFSWDDLRTAICSLRFLIGEEGEGLLRKLLHVTLDPTLFPVPFDLIIWDLACGSLRVMQQIFRGELDKYKT